MKNPLLCISLDGLGIAPSNNTNAFALAKTPFLDEIHRTQTSRLLKINKANLGVLPRQNLKLEYSYAALITGHKVENSYVRFQNTLETYSLLSHSKFKPVLDSLKKNNSKLYIFLSLGNSDELNDITYLQLIYFLRNVRKGGLHIGQVMINVVLFNADHRIITAIEHINNICIKERIGIVHTIMGGDMFSNTETSNYVLDVLANKKKPSKYRWKQFILDVLNAKKNITKLPMLMFSKLSRDFKHNNDEDYLFLLNTNYIDNNITNIFNSISVSILSTLHLNDKALFNYAPNEINIFTTLKKYGKTKIFLNDKLSQKLDSLIVKNSIDYEVSSPLHKLVIDPDFEVNFIFSKAMHYLKQGVTCIFVQIMSPFLLAQNNDITSTIKALEILDKKLHIICNYVRKENGSIVLFSLTNGLESIGNKENFNVVETPLYFLGKTPDNAEEKGFSLYDISSLLLRIQNIPPLAGLEGKNYF